jgi:hypothetical protein
LEPSEWELGGSFLFCRATLKFHPADGAPGTWMPLLLAARNILSLIIMVIMGSFHRGLPGFLSDLGIRTVMARVLHWRNTTIERGE